MKTFFLVAAVAACAAAEQDVFLKEELLTRHLSSLTSKCEESDGRPNLSITTEAGCTALNEQTSSVYYEYEWYIDGCFCSHKWKETAPYYDWWASCDNTSGDVLNPFHEINNRHDRCLTAEEFTACTNECEVPEEPEPTPPIGDCLEAFGNPDAQPTGHASAYIIHDDLDKNMDTMYEGSGFETGWISFTESCGMNMCGADYCVGTCVEGAMWGMFNSELDKKYAVHINEFGVLDPTDSHLGPELGRCAQTGSVWNPDEVAHDLPNTSTPYPPGALGNLELTNFGVDGTPMDSTNCYAQPFSYCAPPGAIKVADIIGRAVVIRSEEDPGTSFDESSGGILACGTLGSIIVNPDLVSLPRDATADGDAMTDPTPSSTFCYPDQAPSP